MYGGFNKYVMYLYNDNVINIDIEIDLFIPGKSNTIITFFDSNGISNYKLIKYILKNNIKYNSLINFINYYKFYKTSKNYCFTLQCNSDVFFIDNIIQFFINYIKEVI